MRLYLGVFMTIQPPSDLYAVAFGTHPEAVEVPIVATGSPGNFFVPGLPLGKRWIGTAANQEWVLTSITTSGGITTPTWTLLGTASGALNTLTGDIGGAIAPSAANINIQGGGAGAISFSNGGLGQMNAQVLVDGVTVQIVGNQLVAGASVPTTFTEDVGSATPAANNLNILGDAPQGISTSGAGSTVTITAADADTAGNKGVSTYDVNDFTVTAGFVQLKGNASGTATTVGAVTADVITFPLGATPGVYAYDVLIAGFDAVTPSGGSYSMIAGARTTGVAGIITGNADVTSNEEVTFQPSDVDLVIVGNNAIVRVTGVAGLTINWRAVLRSVFVS